MKAKWSLQLLVASGLVLSPVFAAQAAPSQDKSDDVRSVTGCLSKGDSAREFKITGEDGSTWEVTSQGKGQRNGGRRCQRAWTPEGNQGGDGQRILQEVVLSTFH
jgi:hypothetical protein